MKQRPAGRASWRRWGGVAEEARTRGFPSSPFGGFIYTSATTKYSIKLPDFPMVN